MATNLSAFLKKNKKYKDDVAYKVNRFIMRRKWNSIGLEN